MKKTARNLLLGSGALITGATALRTISLKASKAFIATALDREIPHKMKNKRFSISKNNTETIAFLKKKAEELKNSDYETIEIESYDGEKLIGHWKHNENAKRIIIAMHGWRSSWAIDFGAIAPFWDKNDCSVLYAEQRGQGRSSGNFMGFGMIERYDCFSWIKKINEFNENRLPIYLAGISMGAATVIMTGGFNLPENVRGIMADCGYTSAKAIWKHVIENNTILPYSIHKNTIEKMCKKKINLTSEEYTTFDALKVNKKPILFIHGTDDHFVPVEMTYENYKACKAPKELFIVPGAKHAMSYLVNKEGYENAVKEFWNKYDV